MSSVHTHESSGADVRELKQQLATTNWASTMCAVTVCARDCAGACYVLIDSFGAVEHASECSSLLALTDAVFLRAFAAPLGAGPVAPRCDARLGRRCLDHCDHLHDGTVGNGGGGSSNNDASTVIVTRLGNGGVTGLVLVALVLVAILVTWLRPPSTTRTRRWCRQGLSQVGTATLRCECRDRRGPS